MHHLPFELVAGIRTGPWGARLALADGRELNAWGMATARVEDVGGAAAGRRSLFMQAVRRAQRQSQSPRREILTRWQPELWVVFVVAAPLAALMLLAS